jgi:hypothetical protein
MGRFNILREIESLDPERDCQRIVHLSYGYEFSWDTVRALEIALYRTYCAPSISALLHRTGEFYRHAQRRYDDTAILLAEVCQWGYEGGRGRAALERINWAHGHYAISNDDFLYVLSTFVFEPVRWIDAFAWRKLCRTERLGFYFFWRNVGQRMGIRDIPPSYDAFEAFAQAYEKQHFQFADTNHRIGAATRDLFASWFPGFLAPAVRTSLYALFDDAMLEAFGFPKPPLLWRSVIRAGLRLRGRLVRWLPPRRTPHFFTDKPNRTHPQGYEIDQLGPPNLVHAEKPRRARG